MREHRHGAFAYYAGQLPAFGMRAQKRLSDSTVLVVGAGRIGANAVFGLHAAGVGAIDVIDPQAIDPEQLGPYWFASRDDIGQPKAATLGRYLSRRGAGRVRGHYAPVESPNVANLFSTADLVICSANTVPARLTAERLAIAVSKTSIQAAAFDGRDRLGGLVHVRKTQISDASCFGCLFEDRNANFRRGEGLLPSVTAMLGHLAAHLAILELSGLRSAIAGEGNLVVLDLDAATLDSLSVERRPDCTACGRR